MFASLTLIPHILFVLFAATWLVACGSGTTFEPLTPNKVVAFGDGAADLGQTGSRYTVNDGTVNTWTERVSISYGRTLTATVKGGFSYASGGARITTGANSLQSQISTHLAKGALDAKDLFLIDGGATELYALAQDRLKGTIATDTALTAAATAAGQAMATEVRRLPAAGAKYVVIANAQNIGHSPFAATNTMTASLTAASRAFNDAMKIALVDLGSTVLLVDSEAYHSLVYNNVGSYLGSGADNTAKACNSATALSCTTSTLTLGAGSNYNLIMHADERYFTPNLNVLWGDQVYSKITTRW